MIHLSSERLNIRSLKRNDWNLFYSLYSSKEVMRWIAPPFKKDYLEKDFEKKLSVQPYIPGEYCTLTIEDHQLGKSIGICAYKLIDDQNVEIGIMLFPEAQGNGIATEAFKILIDFCFGKLGRLCVTTIIDAGNKKATSLVERLNFKFEKKVPHPAEPDNTSRYCNIYNLTDLNQKK